MIYPREKDKGRKVLYKKPHGETVPRGAFVLE